MTRTQARIAEMERISRERSFTDAEVIEFRKLIHAERTRAAQKERYHARKVAA